MSGKSVLEPELTFYGKLASFEDLRKAAYVLRQAQYQRREGDLRIRVRKETDQAGNTHYEFTNKLGSGANLKETTIATTEMMFVAFREWNRKGGMIKDRFVFPIDLPGYMVDGKPFELKWEVDVFPDGANGYHPWVKIDLEFGVQEDGSVVIPNDVPVLPIPFTQVLDGDSKDPVIREVISNLYETMFLVN